VRLDVCFTPGEVASAELGGRVAVVLDVLRATSTIVEALANGARTVFPAPSIDEAVRLAQNIGREQVLLCGERRCLPVEGFDYGNSPRDYTAERVTGKSLVLTTTNGTPALLASSGARRTLVGSFLNLGAVVDALVEDGGPVTVICAGREKRFALEDAVCAGAIVLGLRGRLDGSLELNDAAAAAEFLARTRLPDLERLLGETAAGRQLFEVGLGEDVAYCASIDRHCVVPQYRDRQVVL
jgi:2-phosphosulfolactate phosphatase